MTKGKKGKIGLVLIFVLIAQIFIIPIFAFSQQSEQTEIERLQQDILSAPYDISDYEEDIFKCSNMAAILCDWLDAKGWNAVIVRGRTKDNKDGHAWVEVRECHIKVTTKEIVTSDERKNDYDMEYPFQRQFNDSSEICAYLSVERGWGCDYAEQEYGYTDYLIKREIRKWLTTIFKGFISLF